MIEVKPGGDFCANSSQGAHVQRSQRSRFDHSCKGNDEGDDDVMHDGLSLPGSYKLAALSSFRNN